MIFLMNFSFSFFLYGYRKLEEFYIFIPKGNPNLVTALSPVNFLFHGRLPKLVLESVFPHPQMHIRRVNHQIFWYFVKYEAYKRKSYKFNEWTFWSFFLYCKFEAYLKNLIFLTHKWLARARLRREKYPLVFLFYYAKYKDYLENLNQSDYFRWWND